VVEFAIVVPVVMMVVLVTLDAGRLLYSYLTITNAARVAANFAGANPYANWAGGAVDDYAPRVLAEGLGSLDAFCDVPSPAVPAPVFADSAVDLNLTAKDVGDTARVTVTCVFTPVTPLVGSLAGGLEIGATAVFPIRQGVVGP
jgi:Flp pilus assembly protein TadG